VRCRRQLGREHRSRLPDACIRRQRLAELGRPSSQHREPELRLDGLRCRLERLGPDLLGTHVLVERERGSSAVASSAVASSVAAADSRSSPFPACACACATGPSALEPEAAGAARAARCAAGAEDGLGREPAELPSVDAHPTAAVSWSCPREPGGRPEAGSAVEERPRVLQREVPGPPLERADAEPPCRVGRLRVAASCRSSRLAGQGDSDRGAGPPASRGAVPHQDLLTPA
jgi:hypothetical protein